MAEKRKVWSQGVTDRSDALDLESGVFSLRSPRAIAASLKRSAEHSRRRKGTPFQSAMSMLNFFINRAGAKLSASRRAVLEKAKDELRREFGREKSVPRTRRGKSVPGTRNAARSGDAAGGRGKATSRRTGEAHRQRGG